MPPLDFSAISGYRSRGDGRRWTGNLCQLGVDAIVEPGTRIFHPENVRIGANCFIGHDVIIDGYHRGQVNIGEGSWIGPLSYLHGAAGLEIGRAVGLGPRVTILTSQHVLTERERPVLHGALDFRPVTVEDGADIGAAATILPGVTIGQGAVVGAGAVVTRSVSPFEIVAGCPARPLGQR